MRLTMSETETVFASCAHINLRGKNRGIKCENKVTKDSEYCSKHYKLTLHELFPCISHKKDGSPCPHMTKEEGTRCIYHKKYNKSRVLERQDAINNLPELDPNTLTEVAAACQFLE
mgnify:CR=1 FL=1